MSLRQTVTRVMSVGVCAFAVVGALNCDSGTSNIINTIRSFIHNRTKSLLRIV